MKTHPSRSVHGFTLVELLVVITIIAVLAGAGFAAITSTLNRAKKTKALNTITAIEVAVNTFYSEYSSMPKEISTDTQVDTGDVSFLNILLGLEGNGANVLNTRSLKLLSVEEGKSEKKGGLIYNTGGTTVRGLYDPWGGTYEVMLDGDHDDSVTPAPVGGGGRRLNGRRSAAWSNGADGVNGGGTAADDVKNWQ